MSTKNRYLTTLVMMAAFFVTTAGAARAVAAEDPSRYENARSVVNRVQDDLRQGSEFVKNNKKQVERYSNAQHNLSKFDRQLTKGKFDKDVLDKAIEDVQNVLNNNTLNGQDRDRLLADIRDLRAVRESRGRSF